MSFISVLLSELLHRRLAMILEGMGSLDTGATLRWRLASQWLQKWIVGFATYEEKGFLSAIYRSKTARVYADLVSPLHGWHYSVVLIALCSWNNGMTENSLLSWQTRRPWFKSPSLYFPSMLLGETLMITTTTVKWEYRLWRIYTCHSYWNRDTK